MDNEIYYKYSDYLKETYGEKVYKLPINLPVTCPNRDGNVSTGGCTYCGDKGAGFDCFDSSMSIKDQLLSNMDYIGKRYKAEKFIAYYQNYSNTYTTLENFKKYILESTSVENIVEIAVSTRPDCINDAYLQFLKEVKEEYGINISIELGLQTVNYKTLEKINRGHTLAEFIDATLRIKRYGFLCCAHIILNLPWDEDIDIIETAKIISVLDVDFAKLHALYIVNNTPMAEQFLNNEFTMLPVEGYKRRVKLFLQYLAPDVKIQRIIGRAPFEDTLFVNWESSWWKIKDEIEAEMLEEEIYQGQLCDYRNGKALRKFSD